MGAIRHHIFGNVAAAWLLLALTLAMKLVVPVGFMPHVVDGGIDLIVCNGMAEPAPMAAMPHMTGHHHDHAPSKPDAPCPFAGLTAPTLGGADVAILATPIAAILAAGLMLRVTKPRARPAYLRPPLRGPPARI